MPTVAVQAPGAGSAESLKQRRLEPVPPALPPSRIDDALDAVAEVGTLRAYWIADGCARRVEEARLQIEVRQRLCAALAPWIYGDRRFVEHSGSVELRLTTGGGGS